MFNIFKKKSNKKEEVKSINYDNVQIPFTWELLSKEQKIKIANIVLQGEKTTIAFGGEFNTEKIKECYDITENENNIMFNFHTTDCDIKFYEGQIVDRWLWYKKYGNKDYNTLKKPYEYIK